MNQRESRLHDRSLDDLYAECDALWESYCDLSLAARCAASETNWSDDSEASRLNARLRELRQEIDRRARDLEVDIRTALGDAMREDHSLAVAVYGALCNVDWRNLDGSRYSCSWRHAGGVVNEIVNPDDDDPMGYCNFYVSGGEGAVSERVAGPLREFGWTWEAME